MARSLRPTSPPALRARRLRRNSTLPERLLWSQLRRGKVGVRFRRQHPIGPYITDFYSAEVGLVVEVDGSSHDERQDYDRRRQLYLERRGLTVIRFSNAEVKADAQAVAAAISSVCRSVRAAGDAARGPRE